MTDNAATLPAPSAPSMLVSAAPVFFAVAVFTSAALIFLVEPMIAKLVLPTLGGSPMVWNTCMAFFQASLLLGYGYAHLLQRVKSLRTQTLIHAGVLIVAAAALPLRVNNLMGDAADMPPGLWLLGVLLVSLGAPFAALSATAPLAQAWYARVRAGKPDGANPYVLYVGSNLGSLIALLAYPVIVEPSLRLSTQASSWSVGYGVFVLLMLVLVAITMRSGKTVAGPEAHGALEQAPPIPWVERLRWIGLAAAPSSLMLGVTTHITTDIASAPFLWVAPLALYLVTFIIAFSKRPIPREVVWILHAVALALWAWSWARTGMARDPDIRMLTLLAIHLSAFFLTALVCHQSLSDRRPHPSRLTEFYLWLAVGGVVGGAFNAFVAPVIFTGVWEYPVVMVLACLARPWGKGRFGMFELAFFIFGLAAVAAAIAMAQLSLHGKMGLSYSSQLWYYLFIGAPPAVILVRDRAVLFTILIGAITMGVYFLEPQNDVLKKERSFFGVLELSTTPVPGFTDDLRMLAHGTTLHGAQARGSCDPLTYYADTTPIGQVILQQGLRKRKMVIGAVGMGSGTVAAYVRPDDEIRFFEIDQKVVDLASDAANFEYIPVCAKGKVSVRLGDARVRLREEQAGVYDVLLVDAFSSDAVPAHLLTVEAMREYLERLTPDGVVIMHLSNRHLDLIKPVAAVAREAGGLALETHYSHDPAAPLLSETSEDVIIVAKSRAGLEPFINDPAWRPADPGDVRPWTDDYTNIFAAMMRQLRR